MRHQKIGHAALYILHHSFNKTIFFELDLSSTWHPQLILNAIREALRSKRKVVEFAKK